MGPFEMSTTGEIIVMGWLEITALFLCVAFTCSTVIFAYYMGLREGIRQARWHGPGNGGYGAGFPVVPDDPSGLFIDEANKEVSV